VNPIRVVVADDHGLVRSGIAALLGMVPGVEVVAQAADGHEAMKLVEQHRPRLVLMDISMPGLNGLEATARIVKDFEGTAVIILSMHATEAYAHQALRAGAAGYVLKDADLAELKLAIAAVVRGETYLSPAMSKHLVDDYLRRAAMAPSPLERLTPRHREILQLIAEGHTTKGIAARLELSVKTVESHRTQLMQRLDIHDVAGLVRFAVAQGLVNPGT
jgi:DNA-binding NarL/FixJ family response regulator